MLEHHADPRADRALAVGDQGGPPAHEDLPGVGAVKAVKDRHQRGLARPVFADDPVDRAPGHRDVDVLVRLHQTESLGNAFQFDGKEAVRHVTPRSDPARVARRFVLRKVPRRGSDAAPCAGRGPIRTSPPGSCCRTCSRAP